MKTKAGVVLFLFLSGCASRPPAPEPPAAPPPPEAPPPAPVVEATEPEPEPPAYGMPVLPERPAEPVPEVPVDELHPELERAKALRRGPQAEEARAILRRVREEALQRSEARIAAWALHRHADHLLDVGREEEARRDYEAALEEHLKNGDLALAGRAANDLGLLFDRGSLSSPEALTLAAAWYARAAEHCAAGGDLHGARRALNNKGRMHLWAGELERAIEVWDEAAVAARRLGNPEYERRVHANLALVWLIRAEGGFGGNPRVVVDAAAEAMARAHFLLALQAAKEDGGSARSVCEAWGDWEDRCDRILEPVLFPPLERAPADATRIRGRVTLRATPSRRGRVMALALGGPLFEGASPCEAGPAALAERLGARGADTVAATAEAGEGGLFELSGLTPGRRHDLVLLDGERWIEHRREVEAGAQQLELGRAPTARLVVRVEDGAGRPREGVRVFFAPQGGSAYSVLTGAAGEVDLPRPEIGVHLLALAEDGSPLWRHLPAATVLPRSGWGSSLHLVLGPARDRCP
ncbi:MAG: hypothetical protein P1V51_12020 [Deltaproteobacteria bacterium]|nr:hypothetical protein [Deltaproteobacteria bacterium]